MSTKTHTSPTLAGLEPVSEPARVVRASGRITRLALVAVLPVAVAAVARQSNHIVRPLPVDVVRVSAGDVEETVSNTRAGTVKARRRARLAPEAGGRVVAIPTREGARVRRGALLVKLDDAMQRAQLELARQDVAAASARREEVCLASDLAEVERDRVLTLKRRGIASEQLLDNVSSERDRSRAACRAAQASLEQARARERVARVDLARTELRAPFDGVVAEVGTEIGEWLTPSMGGVPAAPAIDLLDPSSLYIAAPIDEMDSERVAVGQPVRLAVDSRRGEHFEGRLVRVAPYVVDLVEQNRTVEVEAELDDPELAATLLPGTSADVEVILSRHVGVLASKGRSLGFDMDDLVMVPVQTGLSMFNRSSLFRVLVEVRSRHEMAAARRELIALLGERHRAEDVTR
jgi:HlyD family secretion protein